MDNNITPQTDEVIKSTKERKINPIYFKVFIPILIVAIGIGIYIGASNSKLVKSYADKVYPGAFILDKDVSGFSDSELTATLEELLNGINTKNLTITIGDKTFEKSYLNLGTAIEQDKLKEEILSYGKDKNFVSKVEAIKNPEKREYKPQLTYSDDNINEFVNYIADQVKIDAQNASIDVTGATVSVSDGVVGKALNKDTLVGKIKDTFNNIISEQSPTVVAELEEVNPKINSDALKTVNTKISSYTTNYPIGPSGHNIELAAANIDNILLMPGDVFSCEQAIGPTTYERGFIDANTYVGGKVVPGVGGGVCQVASTLYNTELLAGILPSERMNHMMTVSYVPLGLDATLADNLIDLKFENPYDFPIVINAYAGGGSLTVEFWSNSDALGGMTYVPKSYPNGPLYADTYLYGYDASGQLVYEQYIDNSRYQPFN